MAASSQLPTSWSTVAPYELTLARLDEFTAALTSTVNTSTRVVHSSGGAAGGVVSEGQGYGLLLAGAAAAALPSSHPRHADTTELALEYYWGWRRMCERTVANSCQDSHFCGEDGAHECLPSWKFDDAVEVEIGTGSVSYTHL